LPGANPVGVIRRLPGVTSDSHEEYSHDYTFAWKMRRIFAMR
jgi:hypothetical protein